MAAGRVPHGCRHRGVRQWAGVLLPADGTHGARGGRARTARRTGGRADRETALGAARLVIETKAEPGRLRAAVTSPGGTTAAALRVFEAAKLDAIVRQALAAARDRSAELGRAPAGK
ncbi:MAG: hypothetical protein JNG88_19475 [Phycisphaerales bacterium]|nr:hypothetical protein [Phycisphaerales bacterium]